MKKILFCLVIITTSFPSFSQTDDAIDINLLVDAGIEFGGDEVLTLFFTTGGDQTMYAGQGGYIAVGADIYHHQLEKLRLRISGGIKYVTTAADNANIRLTRYPVNVLAHYKVWKELRIGAGMSTQLGAKLKGDGFFSDTEFSSSIGPKFEIGYDWIGLTYTIIDYTDPDDNVLSANSFGVALTFVIGGD